MTPPTIIYTARFDAALAYATDLHRDQGRKGSGIPYLSHLLSVAAFVMEDGGSEDEVIAALLHDAIEDRPRGGQTELEIQERFGASVYDMVAAMTDSLGEGDERDASTWRERKERYLERLPRKETHVLRVAAADKLHNALSILRDLEHVGDDVWDRFNASKEEQLWYYRGLADAFERAEHAPEQLVTRFTRVVAQIEERARRD